LCLLPRGAPRDERNLCFRYLLDEKPSNYDFQQLKCNPNIRRTRSCGMENPLKAERGIKANETITIDAIRIEINYSCFMDFCDFRLL
jgi:hypothetical protein